MVVPINDINPFSRVWIFQASRRFSSDEIQYINQYFFQFASEWNAHGRPLTSAFEVKYNQFMIVAVDDEIQKPSGCSIDMMMNKLKYLGYKMNVELLEKNKVAYIQNDQIKTSVLSDFTQMIKDNELFDSTLMFDNSITTYSEIDQKWLVPVSKSWANRFITRKEKV